MVHEIYQSEIFGNFKTHETPFSVLCKLFMNHEYHPLRNTMKSEISVFMAIKSAFRGFERIFVGFS